MSNSKRLGVPDVSGVEHDAFALKSQFAPVGVVGIGRSDESGVHEVRNHPDLSCRHARRQLGRDIGTQVVREHRDGIGAPIGHPLEQSGDGDHPLVGEHAQFDRDVREDVLDVEHDGDASQPGDGNRRRAEREGRRHREHHLGS